MKERSRERMAALLMEELLEQLGSRESIKRMLGDMTALPVEELIAQLLDDFEQVVASRRNESLSASAKRKDLRQKPTTSPSPAVSPQPVTQPASVTKERIPTAGTDSPILPPPIKAPSIDLNFPIKERVKKAPQIPQPKSVPPPQEQPVVDPVETKAREEEIAAFRRELEERARALQEKYFEQEQKTRESREEQEEQEELERVGSPTVSGVDEAGEMDEAEEGVSAGVPVIRKIAVSFEDTDLVYIHAAAMIEGDDEAGPDAFMLEEKGIDGRSFAFGFDYAGLRFFLSKVNPEVMTLSKTGVLLLGKQESLQYQGVHESILNDLRGHGTLLPFVFGTVARGRDSFSEMIDDALEDLRAALKDLATTRWWTLGLSVLDSRMASLVSTESTGVGRERERERERTSYTQTTPVKKYDVKTLERILQKEKKLAESVHEDLDDIADRSDVDSMVGLGSGTSQDWKLILKASYQVSPRYLKAFYRKITDLQYHHLMFDPMFSLTGSPESFSFQKK